MSESVSFALIRVIEARSLRAADYGLTAWGTSDPYVLVCSGKGLIGKDSSTKVVRKNCNPKWNETFKHQFDNTLTRFKFIVMDKDWLTRDDRLGKLVVPVSDFYSLPIDGEGFRSMEKWFDLKTGKSSKWSHCKGKKLGEIFVQIRVRFNFPVAVCKNFIPVGTSMLIAQINLKCASPKSSPLVVSLLSSDESSKIGAQADSESLPESVRILSDILASRPGGFVQGAQGGEASQIGYAKPLAGYVLSNCCAAPPSNGTAAPVSHTVLSQPLGSIPPSYKIPITPMSESMMAATSMMPMSEMPQTAPQRSPARASTAYLLGRTAVLAQCSGKRGRSATDSFYQHAMAELQTETRHGGQTCAVDPMSQTGGCSARTSPSPGRSIVNLTANLLYSRQLLRSLRRAQKNRRGLNRLATVTSVLSVASADDGYASGLPAQAQLPASAISVCSTRAVTEGTAGLVSGWYLWVVMCSQPHKVRLLHERWFSYGDGSSMAGHTSLLKPDELQRADGTMRRTVLYAGEIEYAEWEGIVQWNNHSGHFKPDADDMEQIAREIGFESSKFVESEYD
jgi:hypothetical protein